MALSALKLVLVFFVNFLMCHLKFSKPVIEGIPLSHVSSWNASRWQQAEAALPPCSAARPLRAHLDSVRSSAGADPGLPLWGSRRQSQQPLLHLLIDLLANRCLLSVSSRYLWIFSMTGSSIERRQESSESASRRVIGASVLPAPGPHGITGRGWTGAWGCRQELVEPAHAWSG